MNEWMNEWMSLFNTLTLKQMATIFQVAILKRIFVNENVWISMKISLKFVPEGPIFQH